MTLRGPRLGTTAIACGAVAVAALSIAPVVYLFVTGISFGDLADELGYEATTSAALQTVQLVLVVTVLTVVLGVLAALADGDVVLLSRTGAVLRTEEYDPGSVRAIALGLAGFLVLHYA